MIVYKITNLINGKIYIGQTVKSLDFRWKQHLRDAQRLTNRALYKDMNLFGVENFTVEQVDTANSIDELDKKEIGLAKALNSFIPNGYNCADYRQTRYHLNDDQRKIRSANCRRAMMNLTKEERSERARKARAGWTLESKKSAADKNKNLRKLGLCKPLPPKSKATLEKMSISRSFQYYIKSPDGKILKIERLKPFCEKHGLQRSSIAKVLKGGRNSCFGWSKPTEKEIIKALNLHVSIGEL
jgi:group I intron endonuclease